MNILFIQNGSGTGGAGHSLDILIRHLDPARFNVLIWTGENGPLVPQWQMHGATVIIHPMYLFEGVDTHFTAGALDRDPAGWRRFVLQMLNLARALLSLPSNIRFLRQVEREFGIALVHVNSTVALTPGLAATLVGMPVIWHVREIMADNIGAKLAGWVIARCSRHIIAISEAAARPFRRRRAPVSVIYNAVDLTRFNPEIKGARIRSELGLGSDPIVGYVGKLYPSKGVFDLIRAAPLVRQAVANVQFLIVGGNASEDPQEGRVSWKHRLRLKFGFGADPDYAAQLLHLASDLGLQDCVHLTGNRGDVPEMLAAMDVVVLPTRTEAFGRTIIEAMAMAKPVVSTTVDAIPELIEHGRTGLLCAPGSPVELADRLICLLSDPNARTLMGKSARACVVERFRAPEHAARISSLYDSVRLKSAVERTR